MSRIQLPYGYVNKQKQIWFDLPKNFEESFYLDKAPHLTNQTPEVQNKLINKKQERFKKMAVSYKSLWRRNTTEFECSSRTR